MNNDHLSDAVMHMAIAVHELTKVTEQLAILINGSKPLQPYLLTEELQPPEPPRLRLDQNIKYLGVSNRAKNPLYRADLTTIKQASELVQAGPVSVYANQKRIHELYPELHGYGESAEHELKQALIAAGFLSDKNDLIKP